MALIIKAANVDEAWALCKVYLKESSLTRTVAPRGMTTLEFRDPVITTYGHPEECVLFDPVRDCNPFYHLYESLWMLAGHRDVQRLAYYVPSIDQFSDDGRTFFGAYGYRLRTANSVDQLGAVLRLLRKDPDSRRGVLGLWRPSDWEEAETTKDLPCNTTAYVKLRDGRLNLTVCNRSNDAVWGCFGANAVQFSFLLQYLAGALGVPVGAYHQVSDSLHVYLSGPAASTWARCADAPLLLLQNYGYAYRGLFVVPLVKDWTTFDAEVRDLTEPSDGTPGERWYSEPFLDKVAYPMLQAYGFYRDGHVHSAVELLSTQLMRTTTNGERDAWLLAGQQWMMRRVK